MRVMEGSGQGDEDITGDEHEEEVPGNEKKHEEKLDGVDAVHHGIEWPDKWPYNSHPATPKTFLHDWPYVDRNRNIDYKPGILVPPRRPDPLPTFDWHEPRSLDFTMPLSDSPTPPEYPTGHSSPLATGGVGSVILVLILAARKWCKRYPGSVRATDVVGAGAAQQHREKDLTSTGQGEADPLYIDMPPPYSDCNNMDVSKEPARGSDPLPHHDNFVEIGFKNECVAMTTTTNASGDVNTEFVSNNDRTAECERDSTWYQTDNSYVC